jgi:hypothetical protein
MDNSSVIIHYQLMFLFLPLPAPAAAGGEIRQAAFTYRY